MQISKDTVEEFWDWSVVEHCRDSATPEMIDQFGNALRDYLHAKGSIFLTTSARHALSCFLSAAVENTNRKVLVSAFNCPVVADSVRSARLPMETFDMASVNGRFDWDKLQARLDDEVAAVVIPHLFGVPTDFRPILGIARKHRILLIEDCAMTLGGSIAGNCAGTIGDAAIFSFGYDKPISLAGGGALLVNNPRFQQLQTPPAKPLDRNLEFHEFRQFAVFLNRRRAAIRHSLRAKIMKRITRQRFPAFSLPTGFGPLRATVGLWALENYCQALLKRNENAEYFARGLDKIKTWHVDEDVTPAWLKQKAFVSSAHKARAASRRLQHAGLRAGRFNWARAVEDSFRVGVSPNAELAARLGLDIPVHQNMARTELERIRGVLWE